MLPSIEFGIANKRRFEPGMPLLKEQPSIREVAIRKFGLSATLPPAQSESVEDSLEAVSDRSTDISLIVR